MDVKVVPGASRSRVVGALGTALKIVVSAAPECGKANAAVIKLLAAHLDVKRAEVQIVGGHSKPLKRVLVTGRSAAELRRRLV